MRELTHQLKIDKTLSFNSQMVGALSNSGDCSYVKYDMSFMLARFIFENATNKVIGQVEEKIETPLQDILDRICISLIDHLEIS